MIWAKRHFEYADYGPYMERLEQPFQDARDINATCGRKAKTKSTIQTGLQIRAPRFDSGRGLQSPDAPPPGGVARRRSANAAPQPAFSSDAFSTASRHSRPCGDATTR